ncbi:hypothetical protein, partial [Enterococcus faecium]|uniref:hypothetical protein n=1 Tax=Enterococcus faecium TaxID=1352 RepID=UPI003F42367D
MRDALDLILGGRSIDAASAQQIGLIEDCVDGATDALSAAHAAVREYVLHGETSALGQAYAARMLQVTAWEQPASIHLDSVLQDDFLQRILRQLCWA